MGLMVGWMAGRIKSGGVGVRVDELASEGGGEKGGTYLGGGGFVWAWHGHMGGWVAVGHCWCVSKGQGGWVGVGREGKGGGWPHTWWVWVSVAWQRGGVVLGLGEAVGLPSWFAGPQVMWWECGGVSVGAWGVWGGKYSGVWRRDVAVCVVMAAMGLVG